MSTCLKGKNSKARRGKACISARITFPILFLLHPQFLALPQFFPFALSPWPGSYLIVTVPFISCFLGLYRNHTCISVPTFERGREHAGKQTWRFDRPCTFQVLWRPQISHTHPYLLNGSVTSRRYSNTGYTHRYIGQLVVLRMSEKQDIQGAAQAYGFPLPLRV